MPLTVYGVAMALQRNPAGGRGDAGGGLGDRQPRPDAGSTTSSWTATRSAGSCQEAIRIHTEVTGERPLGWYTGRNSPNTLELVVEDGGFLYCANSYADELPYWVEVDGKRQLIVPYTLDANDMRFAIQAGFTAGRPVLQLPQGQLRRALRRGQRGAPKMMSVGLHCRLVGRPGRAAALARFLDYVASHEQVWVCRRVDIARHWHEQHAP